MVQAREHNLAFSCSCGALSAHPQMASSFTSRRDVYSRQHYFGTAAQRRCARMQVTPPVEEDHRISGAAEPLALHAIISNDGSITPGLAERQTGVFGIYDAGKQCRYVGLSRDVRTSVCRALTRRPHESWYYAAYIRRTLSRAQLETKRTEWIESCGGVDGCDAGPEQRRWESPIDVRSDVIALNDAQRDEAATAETPVLKKLCRVVQAKIEGILKGRGLKEEIKFDPKLKGKGLLDVQSVKIAVPDTI